MRRVFCDVCGEPATVTFDGNERPLNTVVVLDNDSMVFSHDRPFRVDFCDEHAEGARLWLYPKVES